MSKIFTITQGLENMGAIKTGGQGSVYKAKRVGEIITAIKILPTPIYSESEADKNFVSFQNEVSKLKRVNAQPNANVVTILDSGVTDSGNFPYIEMEYIEGPDLGELLKPPNDPVFTIEEALKVANHLSNALAHCHKANVKHGDIKSNNVKFNIHTGNYILLDFGLSLLSEEERRTSLRHAGAIEFMAPEQNEGGLLFETDIYSFGIILFELLSGSVPFPLKDNGETSRNNVMIAHMEIPPPDLLSLRGKALPASWGPSKKSNEMKVPHWLLNLVYKCLEKDPENRFPAGMELHKQILNSQVIIVGNNEMSAEKAALIKEENERLKREKEQLQIIINRKIHGSINIKGFPKFSSRPSLKSNGFAFRNILLIVFVISTLGLLGYIFFYNKNKEVRKVVPVSAIDSNTNAQLKVARESLNNGQIQEALNIYNGLIQSEIPEALYQTANLALKNQNINLDCNTAIRYLVKAGEKNYAPAKRTLGFLYVSGTQALEQNSYTRCKVPGNIFKGSTLLMEAMLLGDAVAGKLLNELNATIQERKTAAKYEDIYKNAE